MGLKLFMNLTCRIATEPLIRVSVIVWVRVDHERRLSPAPSDGACPSMNASGSESILE